MDDVQGTEGNVRFLHPRHHGRSADEAARDSDPRGDQGGAEVVPLQAPRERGETGQQASADDLLRTLHEKLHNVPAKHVVEYGWDTESGIDFLRTVLAARIVGMDVSKLGRELGVDRLEFVLMAREKDLLT
jgi:hypothetical protein